LPIKVVFVISLMAEAMRKHPPALSSKMGRDDSGGGANFSSPRVSKGI
jgi:hypothetical protein